MLARIVTSPVVTRTGGIHERPGYDPGSQAYYAPPPGFVVEPVGAEIFLDGVSVGTLTLEVRGGQVEDFRPALADALREAADAVERAALDEDEEEVPDAAAHG